MWCMCAVDLKFPAACDSRKQHADVNPHSELTENLWMALSKLKCRSSLPFLLLSTEHENNILGTSLSWLSASNKTTRDTIAMYMGPGPSYPSILYPTAQPASL